MKFCAFGFLLLGLIVVLFLAPFLVLFVVFVAAPAVFGLWISLTNWSPFRDSQSFIGLKNYIDLFTPGSATSLMSLQKSRMAAMERWPYMMPPAQIVSPTH